MENEKSSPREELKTFEVCYTRIIKKKIKAKSAEEAKLIFCQNVGLDLLFCLPKLEVRRIRE